MCQIHEEGEDGERARDRSEEGLQRAPEAVVERSVPILISTLHAPIPPLPHILLSFSQPKPDIEHHYLPCAYPQSHSAP